MRKNSLHRRSRTTLTTSVSSAQRKAIEQRRQSQKHSKEPRSDRFNNGLPKCCIHLWCLLLRNVSASGSASWSTLSAATSVQIGCLMGLELKGIPATPAQLRCGSPPGLSLPSTPLEPSRAGLGSMIRGGGSLLLHLTHWASLPRP
eukprot:3146018-Amphidinium_carterae.1